MLHNEKQTGSHSLYLRMAAFDILFFYMKNYTLKHTEKEII